LEELELKVYPNPILKRKSEVVKEEEFGEGLQAFVDSMRLLMHGHDGAGLAAPQVGVLKRIAVVQREDKFYVLINPELLESEGEQISDEGCLSFPGIFAEVKRPMKVKIRARDASGEEQVIEAEGFLARALLHEMDHLDGKLFIEYLSLLKRNMIQKKMFKRARGEE
jgi:peptide deformylase